ncbi:MAG: hypothetical protein INR71_09300, partial [Terriglobus roseus]|nr:hypothetical protein [Terriglobus roseus]
MCRVRYFTTSRPGAGIFLPLHRASKRSSPSLTADTFPPTPTTPSFSNFNLGGSEVPDVSTMPKFSQSVGPGARPPSPARTRNRPSLPRPESPYKNKPNLAPTPGRGSSFGPSSFSKSVSGTSTPRYSPSPGIGKFGSKARTPSSRNNSRLNNYTPISEDGDNTTPTPATRNNDPTADFAARQRSGSNDEEVKRLRGKLEDRDKQLKEQAASLAEMESSLSELQGMIPGAGGSPTQSRPSISGRAGSFDNNNAGDLRIMLREKNEKIAMLTAEFDAHRADFRSTIDTLEMASTETERVYEKRIEELMEEVRNSQDRSNDVENVMLQFKQLEELVQELEEGLEDARRGEAEARSEVEFLRGEVERGRSELKREREKSTTTTEAANTTAKANKRESREVEQRDDEIRGLKAIIHSLSSAPDMGSPRQEKTPPNRGATNPTPDPENVSNMQASLERLERENKDLQSLVERKTHNEEEMERELSKLRGSSSDNRSSVISDKTATQEKRSSTRDSRGTTLNWRGHSAQSPGYHKRGKSSQMNLGLEPMAESESVSGSSIGAGSSATLWCEICET